jgi:hypothetical protein
MTNPTVPTDGVIVERKDMAEALGIVSRQMGRRISGATIRFEDGWLWVAAGNAAAKAPGQGYWPHSIIVGPAWVRRLAKSLPPGNPVFLRVENGRLYANKYSEPCRWTTANFPILPSLGGLDENRRILEAATALKGFLVDKDDLQSLTEMARKRGPTAWREDEQTMISAVGAAWALLAPLGVETADLRDLIDGAVRNAWKPKKEK